MKKILLIATGGTIACGYTKEGLSPQLAVDKLLHYVTEYEAFCSVDTCQLFSLDSTNIEGAHWLKMAAVIEEHYDAYDGFVICHGTDTMAFSAAALSYLVQNSKKPIVVTGAQKPIDLPVTDARTNLLDSLHFASDDRAHGVNIVFGGAVNAFSSINYPSIAVIREGHITFYIEDKEKISGETLFYHTLNERVLLLKLIPGMDASILSRLFPFYDGVVIESFGVGGFPEYGEVPFFAEVERWTKAGKVVMAATQVTHEGSDMGIYRVGKLIKENFGLMEAYDMTLEAVVTKMMWGLAQAENIEEFRKLFYKTINHDLLFV